MKRVRHSDAVFAKIVEWLKAEGLTAHVAMDGSVKLCAK